jgi:fructose-1,6-bisphosphatase I
VAAKIISAEVNMAGLAEILGQSGKTNIQGEKVQKLDDFANATVKRRMEQCGYVCIMTSEEEEETIPVLEGYEGKYTLAFDPLDGSSNIDVNVSIGTIFSVHRKLSEGRKGTASDLLQKGSQQVAAGYIIYGSSTMLVYTTGEGVHGFTLDPSVGEFFLSHPDIRIPERAKFYSINEANTNYWFEGTKKYVEYLKEIDKATGRPYSLRYIGTLVADFHRNLISGGIFLYPRDRKTTSKPEGKLRLLYEAAPMAMIAREAGGMAITDDGRDILEIEPEYLHQRVPLIIGNCQDVEMARHFYLGS